MRIPKAIIKAIIKLTFKNKQKAIKLSKKGTPQIILFRPLIFVTSLKKLSKKNMQINRVK